jgi:tripartite-type tricarboxylate transporter receptor subunit TctC
MGLIGKHGFSLVVHPSLPVKSLKELIALGRKYPGKLNYLSSGTGSGIHFATELFRLAAKVDLTYPVSFRARYHSKAENMGLHRQSGRAG